MKNILLPTDFSENSWNAIAYTLSFFKRTRCNFYMLNVTPIGAVAGGDVPYMPMTNVIEQPLTVHAQKRMQHLLRQIERLEYNPRHNFITLLDIGALVPSIKKYIEEKQIDLIAMGTKGASGIKEVVIGSNTGDVITRVHCPVLIIPEGAEYQQPAEIAFPTNYDFLYSAKILDTLLEVTNMHDASIRFLHVTKRKEHLTSEQQSNKELLEGYFKEKPYSFHTLTNRKLEAAIQCFAESRNIDMIAMVAKNLNFFQQMLFRPKVEEVSYHTTVPFLVLHE